MYNLRKVGGSFKGIIGECMFKATRKYAIVTRFFGKTKFMTVFGKYFDSLQKEFLLKNWYSLDVVEIDYNSSSKRLIVYEVKTMNKYESGFNFKPKMTLETSKMYNSAKEMGFIVKLVIVHLYDNWDYDIEIKEFDENNYCIDQPKLYDQKANFL